MRAVILAAGSAKRLRPLTEDRPKCMLRVGEREIFHYQLEALRAVGVGPVTAVVGWHAEKFEAFAGRASTILNADYATTNSLYSFWLARESLGEGLLLLNSDVLFGEQLLRELLDCPAPDALLIDAAAQLDAEAMKVEVRDGLVRAMSKDLPPERCSGENLGIIKLSAAGAGELWAAADRVISGGELRAWLPYGIDLICAGRPFAAVECGDHPWIEIDTRADLERAETEVLARFS